MSGDGLVFAKIGDADIDDALAMIAAGTATPRDRETWTGNALTGVLARRPDGRLAAIAPLEPRRLETPDGGGLRLLWHTAAQVAPDLRGAGLGARLLLAAENLLAGECDGFAVYRDDETGRPWRWYARGGHVPVARILSYALPTPLSPAPAASLTGASLTLGDDIPAPSVDDETLDRLAAIWASDAAATVGAERRDPAFWRRRTALHYYRRRYGAFHFAPAYEAGVLTGYVLWAWTEMRGEPRVDALETAVAEGCPRRRAALLAALTARVAARGVGEVRVNRGLEEILALPAVAALPPRWQTSVMVRLFRPAEALARRLALAGAPMTVAVWRDGREETAGDGGGRLRLSYENAVRLALGRADPGQLIADGAAALTCYGPGERAALRRALPVWPWRYEQIDFV